jgi:pimeloyl-ACP methyl ester carboxylesterase
MIMIQALRYRGVNRVHAQFADDATGDPAPPNRDHIRGTHCATTTLGDQRAAVGDHRPARLRPVERGSCQNDVWVTTRDGVRLAVRDCGPRYAYHTVVFLHGFCLSQASWERQIDHLLRRYDGAVRVISYDHRGHGSSGQAPMSSYRIEQLADDLAQVLTARRVSGPLTLVGHSMGGMVALCYLARRPADRPVEPHGLVLAASAGGKLSERGLGRLLATPATGALFRLIDHTPAQALRALTRPLCATLHRCSVGGNAERATLAEVTAAALASTPVPTAVGFLPSLRSYDQYHTLGSIRANTIVVSGGADPFTPASHSHDLAAGIPGAAHVHLPTAGHLLPEQAPDIINAAIRRVMRPLDPARAASPGVPTPLGLAPRKTNQHNHFRRSSCRIC